MNPHAFVAMPFGKKSAPDGTVIDFNAIYETLLKPAIAAAGLDVFRADEEQAAGDIKTDMFQELLIADLCHPNGYIPAWRSIVSSRRLY
jgi:hypothetical protein